MKKIIILSIVLFISVLGYSQGSEMITDGDFSSSTNWYTGPPWSISNDSARYDATSNNFLRQTDADMVSSVEPLTRYTMSFDARLITEEEGYIRIQSTDVIEYFNRYDIHEGFNTFEFVTPADIGDGGISLYALNITPDYQFVIDNLSLIKNAPMGDSPYFVAVDGNDAASGDINNPWKTWGKAFKIAEAGDTIYVRGGVWYKPADGNIVDYFDTRDGDINSGTEGNRIHFFAYPPDVANGDSVIYDLKNYTPPEPDYALVEAGGSGQTSNEGLVFWYLEYYHFKGITIRNAWQTYRYVYTQGFVMLACKNNIIEDCKVENIGGIGFKHDNEDTLDRGVDSTYFINCDAFHCIDSLPNNKYYYENQEAGTWAHGFNIILLKPGDYVEFNGCRATLCADDGWNAQGYGTNRYINTWSFSNGVYLPFMDDITSGNGYKMNTPTVEAYFPDRIMPYPDLIAHYMTNSIAAYNAGYGMAENRARAIAQNRNIWNNTSIGNEVGFVANGYELDPQWDDGRNNEYKNNIAHNNRVSETNSEYNMATNEYNSWNPATGVTVTDADFVLLDSVSISAQLLAPRKADGSLPDITAFHLASGSDLIDAGTDVGLPYTGAAPDLGFAEYGEEPPIGGITTIAELDAAQATAVGGDTLRLESNSFVGNITIYADGDNGNPLVIIAEDGYVPVFSNNVTLTGNYVKFESISFSGNLNLSEPTAPSIVYCSFIGTGEKITIAFPSNDWEGNLWTIDHNDYTNMSSGGTIDGYRKSIWRALYKGKFDNNSLF